MIGLARALWKALPLPVSVRRTVSPAIWSGLERTFERQLQRGAHGVVPGSVKVAGFFSESHGIAASAKRCADALEALGVETERIDLGELSHLALLRKPKQRFEPGGAWIVHANPPELVAALATIGERAFANAFLAGYWAWELPQAPALWIRRKALVDEVWAPSAFTAKALQADNGTQVRVVPHPLVCLAPSDRARARAALNLPADAFISAVLFDFRSSFARKNPLGALAAFQRAFDDDPNVLLVIKAQHGALAPKLSAELSAATQAANIRYIDDIWTLERAHALIEAADVLVSLHRAEGFGLTLAEAMALGTPVVATAWSGNLDFMAGYEGLVPARETPVADTQAIYAGQVWAEPDIAHAATLLQRMRADSIWRESLVARGRALVEERLGLKAYADSLGPAFWAAVRR